jgi:Fe-S cluster biogenesis protein NfuA
MRRTGASDGDHTSATRADPAEVSPEIVLVVDQFSHLVERDGARIEIVDVKRDVLTLRFVAGPADCEVCAFTATDLEQLVGDALAARGSTVSAVTVLA